MYDAHGACAMKIRYSKGAWFITACMKCGEQHFSRTAGHAVLFKRFISVTLRKHAGCAMALP